MLQRFRKTRISLAAKCQLLFGAAVTLIIAAALWVPWGRMDQLTAQLNEGAAQTVVRDALAQHILSMRQAAPSTRPLAAMTLTNATTQPVSKLAIETDPYIPPRLIGVARLDTAALTRFENASLRRFVKDSNRQAEPRFYLLPNGHEGYRYAPAGLRPR